MIEIGAICKINLSEIEYIITDVKRKNITIRLDENTTHQITEYFVDLEERENREVKVDNVSITSIHVIE